MIEAYPLQWPLGYPRTTQRIYGRFKTSFSKARDNIQRQVRMLGGRDMIISTNIPIRRDGLPYAKGLDRGADTAVAVYFMLNGEQRVVACDRYNDIDDNIHAIALTLEAMRGIDRWGASDILNRAFAGMKALPPPQHWSEVLKVSRTATADEVKGAYRKLALDNHQDKGGNDETMARINVAYDQFKEERKIK